MKGIAEWYKVNKQLMRICNSKSSVLVSLLCINSFNIENIQNVRHLARFSSVHFSHSVMSDSATPWTAAHQTSLSINSQSLPKLMSIESVMPSNHFIVGHPLLLLLSVFQSIKVFSNESALHIRWPKYWSFSFNISPSKEHSGLIFRMDWLDLLAVQETLKSLLQHHSSIGMQKPRQKSVSCLYRAMIQWKT